MVRTADPTGSPSELRFRDLDCFQEHAGLADRSLEPLKGDGPWQPFGPLLGKIINKQDRRISQNPFPRSHFKDEYMMDLMD
jgi:hypothetical protein